VTEALKKIPELRLPVPLESYGGQRGRRRVDYDFAIQTKGKTMKLLTQLKQTLIVQLLVLLAVIAGGVLISLPAQATSSIGVTTEFIVGSTDGGIVFDPIHLSLTREKDPVNGIPGWRVRIDTKGISELFVVRNTFAPNSTSGWHTHPGPSLISVLEGTITAYEGDDPTCTPHVYTAPASFIDEGGEHVHLLRNEDPAIQAITVAVQLIPQDEDRRIDAPNPGYCPDIN
jgi:quercetin dioxygenase-like cupin family protein